MSKLFVLASNNEKTFRDRGSEFVLKLYLNKNEKN